MLYLLTFAAGVVSCFAVLYMLVVSGSPLMTGYDFTSFAKTSADTLKVFVNHTFSGS